MIDFWAKILTMFVFDKSKRREARDRIKTLWNTRKLRRIAKHVGKNFICGTYCRGNENLYIGNNVRFNQVDIHGGGTVKIGDYCQFGMQVLIITQNHNYEGKAIPYDEELIYKEVEIGDFVWIGSRVMILPGTKIGEGAIIQGGSVVHGEIPPYAIAGGNPAKVFKYRDIKHFKKLKAEGKFH